jgi:hypothetical protein
VFASPYFKGVRFEAKISGGFVGVELGFTGHGIFSFSGFAVGTSPLAGFEKRICGLKGMKISGSGVIQKRYLRELYVPEVLEKIFYKIKMITNIPALDTDKKIHHRAQRFRLSDCLLSY